MLAVLAIVAPVFGLIILGYLSGRLAWLSPAAEKGVAEFAFSLAIPALLFKTVATAEFADLSVVGVWGSYFGTVGIIWLLAALTTTRILHRPAQDGPSIAISSAFGNLLMLGLPLTMATYGNAATATIALILSIHAPTLWLTATLHAGLVDREANQSARDLISNLVRDLSRNPIIIAIALGALWRVTTLTLPAPILTMLTLLAQSGVAAALIALGLSLVKAEIKGQAPTLSSIVLLKLIAMPTIAYLLASQVFQLSPVSQGVITIFASVPTGANAFLFASKSGRAINSASGAIALGTVLSAVTISILLAIIQH
ncbi:conserved membrane protein of unknown function [Candidatus Filomicrobium marinum]|uniref:AEC family transporter n=2 Tax=Filomicrobium TaxID=119044 RepID=A0A0D6JC18_9HYPH|nr:MULTISPECIES: AEC family transporter [Filomicrobium]MCV0370669.1 AEC family transporter [Filomicrobium sp.]CFX06986.1 conserved membrane protein of unknown function [Candidatus Filomicrobium marinum]CPR16527.1 conserved membrane protein of unknown function [Candidatus Filomicrobium marinum]SDP57437.1 hypothetical protein SAMN04488061_3371 [Filomicrobium insigne]